MRTEDNRKMVRLPNGRWVFEEVVSATKSGGDSDLVMRVSRLPANSSQDPKDSKVKLPTDLDKQRLKVGEALLWARDVGGAEWRKVSVHRYEAFAGKKIFFVEFLKGSASAVHHGWLGESESKMDEWMLENSLPGLPNAVPAESVPVGEQDAEEDLP